MFRLHLEAVIITLGHFVLIFREDDILPPGLTDGGFLDITVVYFNSNVLVVSFIYEGKPTTGLILPELLMGPGHLIDATLSDEPLVCILL